MRFDGSMRATGAALATLLLGSGCSLALDFGDDAEEGRPDARPRDASADGSPLPPGSDAGTEDASGVDASPVCQPGGPDLIDPLTGTCYVLYERGQAIADVRPLCATLGGHLASITTADERALILPALADAPYWIGLGDAATEGTLAWEHGEPVAYTNWRGGEPNDAGGMEDCVVMYGNYAGEFAFVVGLWDDRDCSNAMRAICEIPRM